MSILDYSKEVLKRWSGYPVITANIWQGFMNRYPTLCSNCNGPMLIFPGVCHIQPCPYCQAEVVV